MNAELLRRIIKSYRSRDDEGFASAVQKLIESERKQGHVHLAKDLSNLLNNGHTYQLTRTTATVAHPPRSKAEGLSLIDVRRPTKTLRDIVMGEETKSEVQRILDEFSKRTSL